MSSADEKTTSTTLVSTRTTTSLSSYPTSRLSAPFAPIDQTLAIEEADRYLGAVARGQLQMLAEQILYLQEKARGIISQVEVNRRLHRASCRFQKTSGQTYHLYHRSEVDDDYFSLLSPEEWGAPPHEFVGSFTLNEDMSWTRIDDFSR